MTARRVPGAGSVRAQGRDRRPCARARRGGRALGPSGASVLAIGAGLAEVVEAGRDEGSGGLGSEGCRLCAFEWGLFVVVLLQSVGSRLGLSATGGVAVQLPTTPRSPSRRAEHQGRAYAGRTVLGRWAGSMVPLAARVGSAVVPLSPSTPDRRMPTSLRDLAVYPRESYLNRPPLISSYMFSLRPI